MQTYHYKKKYSIGIVILFAISAVIGLKMILSNQLMGILLSTISIVLAYVFYKVKVTFVTTDECIKKIVFNKEDKCNWKWIYAINTERSTTTGDYCTVISWSKLDHNQLEKYLSISNKCNEDVGKMLITSHVAGYKQLLQDVVSRNADISLDETTRILLK